MSKPDTPPADAELSADRRHKRNEFGVKDAASRWRTFNGQHYVDTATGFTPELLRSCRESGIRARKVNEDLFIHKDDGELFLDILDGRALARASSRAGGQANG